ncbi:hypothetical protein GCM10011349_47300 [Novosphingobium indicum]|uniref:Uncharacterized protein n=1 Tax=Novosphingobium indicum TaxID=462949 RepID=A0ABQ2K3M0_9SPHN|nr:hypothetical protein GCM10011349_47300 [Novosphingobium indicum]
MQALREDRDHKEDRAIRLEAAILVAVLAFIVMAYLLVWLRS